MFIDNDYIQRGAVGLTLRFCLFLFRGSSYNLFPSWLHSSCSMAHQPVELSSKLMTKPCVRPTAPSVLKCMVWPVLSRAIPPAPALDSHSKWHMEISCSKEDCRAWVTMPIRLCLNLFLPHVAHTQTKLFRHPKEQSGRGHSLTHTERMIQVQVCTDVAV